MSYIKKESLFSAVCKGCNEEFSSEHCEPCDCSIRRSIMSIPTANVVEIDELKELIKQKYGDLDNNRGCNVNGQWLSVASLVGLIDQAAKE